MASTAKRIADGEIVKKVILGVLLATSMLGSNDEITAAAGMGAQLTVHKLAIPGKPWALEIVVSPQYASVKQFETETSFYLQNKKTDISILATLEKASVAGDAIAARDYYTKKKSMGGLQAEDIKQYEIGEAAVREYMIKDSRFRVPGGDALVVRNLDYYLSHDGYWAEIQISKLRYQPSDAKLFDAILANIKIAPLEKACLLE